MNNYKNEVKTFKALTDINRLLILDLLMNGETCSCMMIEKLPIKQSTISHHMKILIDSELVEERKDGKYSYYSLSKSGINSAIEYLNKYLNANSGLCVCSNKVKT
jgi:ArsR family transcriptional regulator